MGILTELERVVTVADLAALERIEKREVGDAFEIVLSFLEGAFRRADGSGRSFVLDCEEKVEELHAAAMKFCEKCGICCPPNCKARTEEEEGTLTVYCCALHSNVGAPAELDKLCEGSAPALTNAERRELLEEEGFLSMAKPGRCRETTPTNCLSGYFLGSKPERTAQMACVRKFLGEAERRGVRINAYNRALYVTR